MNVEGVALDKVDQKLVASSAKKFAVATKGKTLGTVVRELAAKLRDGDGDMDACTECGGPWPAELDACPFCGDLANPEEEAKGDPADGSSRSDSEASSSVAPSEVESSTAAGTHERSASVRSTLTGAGAPVVVAQTEVQLDKLVAAVNAAKEQGAKNFWMVVTLLKRCIDTNLWKQRVDEKGNPAYRSAWEFATKELEFSRTYAQRLYRTASEFSEKTIDQLGVNRLGVLAAPEASREKLLEEARAGASRSKLAGMTRGLLDEQRAKEGKARPGAKSKVAPVALAPVAPRPPRCWLLRRRKRPAS